MNTNTEKEYGLILNFLCFCQTVNLLQNMLTLVFYTFFLLVFMPPDRMTGLGGILFLASAFICPSVTGPVTKL